MMFPRTYGLVSSETRTLPKNTAALEALCQRYPGKVNVMLVPCAGCHPRMAGPSGLWDEGSGNGGQVYDLGYACLLYTSRCV